MKIVQTVPKLPKRKAPSHKGDYGTLYVIAGSQRMTGAAVLATQAALRSGVGRVTLAVPKGSLAVAQSHLLEPTFLPLSEHAEGTVSAMASVTALASMQDATAAVLGPGLGLNLATQEFVQKIVREFTSPLLLDADGLNALATRLSSVRDRHAPTVLTPHPGEMARLMGTSSREIQLRREEFAMKCSCETKAVVVLKGHQTIVTDGKKLYRNRTGNPGMAKAGMGDILSGMIGALLARGLSPFEASVLGVYLHGKAGDKAAKSFGMESMVASDLLRCIRLG